MWSKMIVGFSPRGMLLVKQSLNADFFRGLFSPCGMAFLNLAPIQKLNKRELCPDLRLASRLIVLCLGMAAVSVLSGCHSMPTLTPQEAEGKHLYQIRCAHCHEDNDLGLKKAPPALHSLFTQATLPSGAPASDAEVSRAVLAGKGMMPSFNGRFTDQQMSALLAYLHTGLR
jgi:cytochrome c5